MEYKKVIENELDRILRKVRRSIEEDETIFEFVKTKKNLKALLDKQEELVRDYLINFREQFSEEVCRQFYKELNIPYTIVYRSLNLLKNELLKALKRGGVEEETLISFNDYFQKFLDLTAKVYLKKDIVSLRKIANSPFAKYLLFSAHISFINQLVEAIVSEELDLFPVMDANDCEFVHYLYYPESLMVCVDKNLCMYLEDLHSLIHKTANSFFVFYSQKRFAEGYFIFKDLKEQILKFTKLISELYFVTYSDLENSFFRLIELMEYEYDLYLTLIDLKTLKVFNQIYSESVVTKAINLLEERIRYYINGDIDRVLEIKGISSNFYILNVGYTQEEYEEFIKGLRRIIKEKIEIDGNIIEFDAIISGVKINKYSDFKEKELLKIMNYIKKETKKEKENISLFISSSKQQEIEEMVNNRYNEAFILKKIENKEVDIAFQPIYRVKDKELITMEVLGRVKDEDKLIPAGVFIEKIYELNLIEKFDMLILEKILEKEKLIKKVSNNIFINISFQSILSEEYMAKLMEFLEKSSLDVTLELTEQKFIDSLDLITEIHKKYGVYFAVDDFGSGYSSLQSLLELVKEGVLKVLKIDGSLIKNMENDFYMEKIVKIISTLGKEFDLKTVAEFVENEKVIEKLKSYEIDLAQGYYLSKPKTINELIAQKAGVIEF